MTIDVALLRQLAAQPNTSLVAYGPVVLLKPTTVSELLDAYEAHSECETIQEQVVAVSRRWHELYNAEFDKTKALTEERDGLRVALDLAHRVNRHYEAHR